MTGLLEQAFAQAAKLPPEEQDAVAHWLLIELKTEHKWNRVFSESQDVLSRLASEALAEHRQGDTRELDADNI